MRKPVVIAPAMNDQMYCGDALQDALQSLTQRPNINVLDCAEGFLACGTNGRGRMQEPEALLEAVETALTPKDRLGQHVLITAGATREAIDPVRFISNHSSGKMGIALAKTCLQQGADVTLVMGATTEHWSPVIYHPAMQGVGTFRRIDVVSAQQMYEAATNAWAYADIAILAAAVADMTPATVADHKMKKGQDLTNVITLKETQDIARTLGKNKRSRQTLVGFALETDNEQQNALKKLQTKNLDYIVMNSLREQGAGFGTDTNSVTVFTSEGESHRLPLASKQLIAEQILRVIR